jgi:hypothetical protein
MHDALTPILASVPLQLLAYHIAVLRGANVDQPRNLAERYGGVGTAAVTSNDDAKRPGSMIEPGRFVRGAIERFPRRHRRVGASPLVLRRAYSVTSTIGVPSGTCFMLTELMQ